MDDTPQIDSSNIDQSGLSGDYQWIRKNINQISKHLTQYQDIARFRYYRASNQAITTASTTKIQIDTLSIDPLLSFDSANNRMVIKIAGFYWVYGKVQFGFNGNTAATLSIYKNGASVSDFYRNSGNLADQHIPVADFIQLEKGDYLELFINHNVGVDANVLGGSLNTYLAAFIQSRKY